MRAFNNMGEILALLAFTAKLPFSFHGQVLQQEELKETTERSDGGERLCTASQVPGAPLIRRAAELETPSSWADAAFALQKARAEQVTAISSAGKRGDVRRIKNKTCNATLYQIREGGEIGRLLRARD